MIKTITTIAAVAMLSTTAMAADWDNTAVKVTAQTDDYSISVKSPKTGATEFAVGGIVASVDATVKWKRNGAVDDFAVKAGKSVDIPATPLYAGASGSFTVRRCNTHHGQTNAICRTRLCMAVDTEGPRRF